MKYWWLEKYKNLKIVELNKLIDDINYFLVMPNNYKKQYEILKNKNIDELEEEELLILLYKIVNDKNIKDNTLIKAIEKLLLIPDNSFPKSDYSISEMIEEIKNLKKNYPYQEKINNNNIAVCYYCLNVFYVDKIKSVNKNKLCLCPFCLKTKLYFDNDYIPMNYTFIKLANIYYRTSSLGCTFKEVTKIIKKNIKITTNIDKKDYSINITELLENKITPISEKQISKEIYEILNNEENDFKYSIIIKIDNIEKNIDTKLILLIISLIDFLSNSFYLKEIIIETNKNISKNFKKIIREIIK